MSVDLKNIVTENRSGRPTALPSFCTANTHVLREITRFAAEHDLPALIEATCNQVNQFGGYTGLRPAEYAASIRRMADAAGMDVSNLILGGDHLGPNPWRHLPADEAMEHAKGLVKDYVEAGFTKIHLDASMACGGEAMPSFELVAQRSAELCVVAEKYAPDPSALSYVIGTEVPIPGGESDDMSGISVTTPERLTETIETHRLAFGAAGVPQGIEKSVAVVVQPGVDFSHEGVFHYDCAKATDLTAAIQHHDDIAFEAHSTDYQSTENLYHLVADHSVILKVGPELTFRFREGVMALDQIEAALNLPNPAAIKAAVLKAMDDTPDDWKNYYSGSSDHIEYLKLYSLSDRIRYYWERPNVSAAFEQLTANLTAGRITAAMASQFGATFPVLEAHVAPEDLISPRIETTIARYYHACGWI